MVKAKVLKYVLIAAAAFATVSCHELKKPGDLSGKSLFGTNIGQGRYVLLTFDADPVNCTLSKYVDPVPYAVRGNRIDTLGKRILTTSGKCNRVSDSRYALEFNSPDVPAATMYYYEGVYYFRMGAEAYPMPEP